MSRVIAIIVLSWFSLLSAGLARGEERLRMPDFQIGVGTGLGATVTIISSGGSYSLGATSLYIPMIISRNVKFEPSIGYMRNASSNDEADTENASDSLRIGAGFFYAPLWGRTALNVGMRVGIDVLMTSMKAGSVEDDDSTTNFFIGPALGAEYFVSDYFSVGAEAQFLFYRPEKEGDVSSYTLGTVTQGFLRVYFMKGGPARSSGTSSSGSSW